MKKNQGKVHAFFYYLDDTALQFIQFVRLLGGPTRNSNFVNFFLGGGRLEQLAQLSPPIQQDGRKSRKLYLVPTKRNNPNLNFSVLYDPL